MTSHFPQADVNRGESLDDSTIRIGRTREHQHFVKWLTSASPATEVVCVSGIGGIGKTTLMMEMARTARQEKVRVLWLDCRTSARMPADFLTSIEMSLSTEYGVLRNSAVPLLAFVTQEFTEHTTVLFMDNCENIDLIEGWLLTNFLPQLNQTGILLVFGSRTGLPITWQTNPYWRKRLTTLHLDVFTDEEMQDYLAPYAMSDQVTERIARETRGHPLSVALAVEAVQFQDGQVNQVPQLISGVISAQLLKEVAEPSLHEALQVLSTLSVANQTELAKLTKHPLDLGQYHALARLSFIQSTPRGLSLHDVVKQVLRQDLQQRDPETFHQLAKDTIRMLADQYPGANSAEQIRIASQVLELYGWLRAIRHEYANFSTRPKTGPHQPFQSQDLPYLHRLLEDSLQQQTWQCELITPDQHHALLDALAADCPEGIRVVRSATGIPLVFNAGVWLHRGTMSLLETYAPRVLMQALPAENHHLRSLPREFMDSVIVLLSAVDTRHPVYKPEEIGMLSFEDWFSFTGAGARTILISGDPSLNSLLQMFGFHSLAQLPPPAVGGDGEDSNQITVFALDFRNTKFPSWVQKMIQELDAPVSVPWSPETMAFVGEQSPTTTHARHSTAGEPAARPDPAQLAVNPSSIVAGRMQPPSAATYLVDVAEVKELLQALPYINRLEGTTFAQQQKITGIELQHRIQQLLSSETPAFPMTMLYQAILRESFLHNQIGKDLLAERFNMSRATFYRHSRRAMLQFAQALHRSYTIETQ